MGTGGLFLRKLRAKVAAEPTGFVWIEEGKVAGSGYPASRAQVEWVAKSGIRSILTLTEEPLPQKWLEGLDVACTHLPIKDHELPSLESMEKGVEFISVELAKGRPVLVHCLAGEGRTGCVLSAYLIRSRGMDPGGALEALRRTKPAFVERRQEKAVYDYAARESALPSRT